MALDALTLSVITNELAQTLVGGKINKIMQPERDEVILNIYNNRNNHRLLLSANASVNRVHLTEYAVTNAPNAPSFCMLLRKHLLNATITGITQMPYERVIDITLLNKDELGYTGTLHLIFELTGKTSNTILTNENYVIFDCIKHLPQDLSTTRLIMAGGKYSFFPPQNKLLITDSKAIAELITTSSENIITLLASNVLGVSTETITEMLFRLDSDDHSQENCDKINTAISSYLTLLGSNPNVVFNNGTPKGAYSHEYHIKGERMYFDSLNTAHDKYYYYLDRGQRFKNKSKSTTTIVKNAISRCEKKIAIQKQSIIEASTSTTNKTYGDLILSNLHMIKGNQTELNAIDYMQEDCPTVTIPLEGNLSPQQNAQKYYKKYHKQKSTIEHSTKQIEENSKLLDYLLSIQQSLKNCTDSNDLNDIVVELREINLIKDKKSKIAPSNSSPIVYNVDGYKILVGKNNLQNNDLTFKIAKPHDMWLHTQSVHSCHTIIVTEGKEIPDNVLLIASQITAYYSQSRNSSKILVDYTVKSNIKKPPKARLGYVIYHVYNTIIVDPHQHSQYIIE